MLSPREIALTAKISECMSEYRQLLYDDGPGYFEMTGPGDTWDAIGASKTARDGDINEFAHAVHVMQRMVMARCAQRMYPNEFRRRPAPVAPEENDAA
jgi:hypothetical protein